MLLAKGGCHPPLTLYGKKKQLRKHFTKKNKGKSHEQKLTLHAANNTSVESVSAEILADVGVGGSCGLRQLLLD